jgi:hypothetical protein
LRREALVVERWNRRHPESAPREGWLQEQLGASSAPIVAASDWVTALPDLIAPWIKVPYVVLGTDGFGLSDTREALRDFFSVDAKHIAAAAMVALLDEVIGFAHAATLPDHAGWNALEPRSLCSLGATEGLIARSLPESGTFELSFRMAEGLEDFEHTS